MKNYDLEKELKRHPYEYYGDVKEEKHGEGTFILRRALQYVIDDYDDAIGSIEQSHYEKLGYYKVGTFDFEESPEELDLTWMDPNDSFDLDESEQYKTVKTIKAKIDNLDCSYLPISDKHQVLIVVYHGDTKHSLVRQIKIFTSFISFNSQKIAGIKLVGFSPLVEKLLELYAKRYNIEVIQEEKRLSK